MNIYPQKWWGAYSHSTQATGELLATGYCLEIESLQRFLKQQVKISRRQKKASSKAINTELSLLLQEGLKLQKTKHSGKSHCVVALFFHFSLSILGNTTLNWTSSVTTQYVIISFGRSRGKWMTNGKLQYHCRAEPLKDSVFHTEKQQILTNESASFPEVLHPPAGASGQSKNERPRTCSRLSSVTRPPGYALVHKRNAPGMPKFLHSYLLEVLKGRQESTTRLKLQGICTQM